MSESQGLDQHNCGKPVQSRNGICSLRRINSHLPIRIGTPNNGHAVVMASGFIFIAAVTDDLIRAIDIQIGETLWQNALPENG